MPEELQDDCLRDAVTIPRAVAEFALAVLEYEQARHMGGFADAKVDYAAEVLHAALSPEPPQDDATVNQPAKPKKGRWDFVAGEAKK